MLETKQLTFRDLIKNISLTFFPGNLYGILGPNGSGKSTFFKTLAKIWKPTSGHVFCNGENLHKKERLKISRTISLVPQEVQILFDFSVREFVQMGRYPHQNKSPPQLFEKTLKIVDAWHLCDRSISNLSIGERQRIYIARALMTESPILLLDEPASNLDIKHQIEIWQLLQTLASENKIIIVATHDIMGIKRFCNRVAIFNQGKCIAKGETKEVLTELLLSQVFGVLEQDSQFVLTKKQTF